MDLLAYTEIDNLEQIAKENNIEVPRLRGYRLMKNEKTVSSEKLKELMKDCEVDICERLCCKPSWNPNSCFSSYDDWTDYLCKYYLIESKDENGYKNYTDIRWNRIHGWKRKVLKFEIKKQKKRIKE